MKLIGNRYDLVRKLGQGGMGSVFVAQDHLERQIVALKQVALTSPDVPTGHDDSQDALISLAVEFRILASLRHPHIISVVDYGFDADRQPFFTMQYLPDAQTIIQAAQGKPLETKVRYLNELLLALIYLHRRGIIHRDLKPDNILVNAEDQVKVLDFGLAQGAIHDSDVDLSDSAAGTMRYMSPELFSEESASIQSDLYAVGLIAYEIFTDRFPFDFSTIAMLIYEIMTKTPDTSDLAPELKHLLDQLLAKNPAQRPDRAEMVMQDLCAATQQPVPVESDMIRESFLQASTFVGRDSEYNQLKDALLAISDKISSTWLIGGESGVGKSRLLEELRVRALVNGIRVVRGQASADAGLPYQLWRDILRQLTLSTNLTELEARVLKAIVPDISEILGQEVDDAPELPGAAGQERLALTIVEVIIRQRLPILILLEDLHWMRESLSPLKLLVKSINQHPIMVVGTFRSDENPDLPSQLPMMQLMNLQRLGHDAIGTLSAAMLGDAGRQPQLIELLIEETEGNALFIVEVMRALATSAGSLSAIGQSALPERVTAGGIQQILRRRLAQLPEWARSWLNLAAVSGRRLDRALLMQAGELSDADYEFFLTACANIAVLENSDGGWRFTHDKLRETLLNDIAVDAKRRLHRQVAEVIEQLYPDSAAYVEPLYDHWSMVNDRDKMLAYLQKLADYLILDLSQYQRAITLVEDGIADLDEGDVRLPAFYVALTTAYMFSGDYGAARDYAIRVINFPGSAGDRAASLTNLGIITYRLGDYAASRAYHQESLDLRTEIGDQRAMATSMNNLGVLASTQGDIAAAKQLYEQSLAIREQIDDQRGIAQSLDNLGVVAFQNGDYDIALGYGERGLVIRKKIGDRRTIGVSLNNIGVIYHSKGDYVKAKECQLASLAIRREIEDRYGIASSLINLGFAYFELNEIQDACQAFHDGLTLGYEIGFVAGCLDILAGYAKMLYRDDEKVQSAKVLGFIENHPSTSEDTRVQHLVQLRQDLVGNMNLADFEMAVQQGPLSDIDEVIGAALIDLKQRNIDDKHHR